MINASKYFLPVCLAFIADVRCASAFAFRYTSHASATRILAAVDGKDVPSVSPENLSAESDVDPLTRILNDNSNGISRRNAVGTSLSLLTAASCLPAFASDTEEPYRVLFTIQLDSTKPGDFSELEIEVRPDWAPLAANRFRTLVELGFYQDCPFFRVLPGYVAQFGISADPSLNNQWMYCDNTDVESKRNCKPPLPDEPRKQPNKKGTLSFASAGKNTRKNQVFINLANNDGPPNFLDAQGFTPFAKIVRGMDETNNIPKQLNSEYGGKVNQGKAAYYGGEYFTTVFPRLSVIKDAKVI